MWANMLIGNIILHLMSFIISHWLLLYWDEKGLLCRCNLKITLGRPGPLQNARLIHSFPLTPQHAFSKCNSLLDKSSSALRCKTMPHRRQRLHGAINKAVIWKEKQNYKASNCNRGSNLCSAGNNLSCICRNRWSLFPSEKWPTVAVPSYKLHQVIPYILFLPSAQWTLNELHSSKVIEQVCDGTDLCQSIAAKKGAFWIFWGRKKQSRSFTHTVSYSLKTQEQRYSDIHVHTPMYSTCTAVCGSHADHSVCYSQTTGWWMESSG